jgi:hypothetical protein
MRDLVAQILADKALLAKEELKQKLQNLVNEKLNQVKMRLAAEMYEEVGVEVDFVDEEILDEANVQRMGRTKMIRVRIRNGKVQRRVKKSAVKGYTIRGGKMVRMSAMERRHRKMAARRAKFKRRAKMKQSIRKRQRSLRRRKALGVR